VTTESHLKWGDIEHKLVRDAKGNAADLGVTYQKTTDTLHLDIYVKSDPSPGMTVIDNTSGKVLDKIP
jgi:hypothetical protein